MSNAIAIVITIMTMKFIDHFILTAIINIILKKYNVQTNIIIIIIIKKGQQCKAGRE